MRYKLSIWFVGYLLLLIAVILCGATIDETHTTAPGNIAVSVRPVYRKMVVSDAADGDANDFTETLESIYGYLDRIVIDSNGTDTDYDVTLLDEHEIELFTKTDCSSASEPYSYILSEVDVDDNAFPGIPVAGACKVVVADIDDASADAITITIYYVGYYQ